MKSTAASVVVRRTPAKATKTDPQVHAILENIADVICTINTKGQIAYVSSNAFALWGYNPEELLGRSYAELIPAEDLSATRAALDANREEDYSCRFETRFRRKDGVLKNMSWSARWNSVHQLFYCVIRESTAAQATVERLLRAQANAGLASFEYDVHSKSFTYLSRNAYSIFGIAEQPGTNMTPANLCALIHPEDIAQVHKELLHPTEKKEKSSIHYRIVRPDGAILYIHHNRELLYSAAGEHIKTQGTFQDVTGQIMSGLALQQSEKRYRALVAGGHDLVGIVSAQGIYTYVGDNIEPLLGVSKTELEGKSFAEFIHPEDLPMLGEYFQLAVAQPQTSVPQFRFRNSKAEWRWMETRVTNLLHDPHINGLVVNSRDITEEKAANDKLRELSLIAQESLQPIIITNISHQITWVNKAFCTISGYSIENVMGKTLKEVFAGTSEGEKQFVRVQQKLQQGLCVQKELLCHDKGRKPYWMQLHIQPVYNDKKELLQYLAIGKDITESKKALNELARSEQRFKALVQEGSDVIVIVDKEGLFTYCSDSVQKVLGYEPHELLHKNLLSFIYADDVAETLAGIERVKEDKTTGGVRHRFRHKNGGYIWLESKGTNHFKNPLVQGMIVNARDITEKVFLQKKLDAELLNKQKQITSAVIKAQESERSKLGLELHDNVNQVLTTVKLYNEMYLSGYLEDRSLLERSAKYLQDCINEIRSISKRLSAPTLGKITLQDSISDLVDSINLTDKLQVFLHTEGVDQLYIAEDLHLGIYRIIQEALNNVIKYAQASFAEIQIEHVGNMLSLLIRDDGKGFNSTAKRKGIGITNMKTRAENLNGVFQLHTAEGEGCTIEVSFLL